MHTLKTKLQRTKMRMAPQELKAYLLQAMLKMGLQ